MGVEPTTFGLEVRRASPLRYGDYKFIDDVQPLLAYRNDESVLSRVGTRGRECRKVSFGRSEVIRLNPSVSYLGSKMLLWAYLQ